MTVTREVEAPGEWESGRIGTQLLEDACDGGGAVRSVSGQFTEGVVQDFPRLTGFDDRIRAVSNAGLTLRMYWDCGCRRANGAIWQTKAFVLGASNP